MNLENLEKILVNQPKYRVKQAYRAIFFDLVEDWSAVSNLPLALRQTLAKACDLKINGQTFVAKNQGTVKTLITLADGLKIETVLLRHSDGRNTVCVSTQVGCPMGCLFCATGAMGFKRNLTQWEILEQVLFFSRELKSKNQKVSNVVFMGMGEPFLNYDNVLAAIRILNDPDYLNLGARRISISTSGVIEGIEKLIQEGLQVNLAISLHASNDALRSELMPVNQRYPLKELLATVADYAEKTNRKVMFEYLLIDGINDSTANAQELAQLMKNKLFMVNLIPYNPTGKFKPSPGPVIKAFKDVLAKAGINVTQRYAFGQDIDASCGQLATRNVAGLPLE